METTSQTAEIVENGQKRDRRGRTSWPKQRREELLAEYDKSWLSQTAFARRAGVRYPTFAHWVQERRRGGSTQSKGVVARFVEVGLPMAPTSSELSVTLPGGLVACGADAHALASLVRALSVQV